ncbi:MAG: hypothetical protein IRZ16_17605 [Myxococcaceae bacterium]|nr:hypothetical protein [Myxococcaceae bacterium]
MRRREIVDTVAFIDGRDVHHRWVTEALRGFEAPLSTCDSVISEVWFLLGRVPGAGERS